MKKDITQWENDMRSIGYTNKDLIDITMTILKVYDHGRLSHRNWFVKLIAKIFKL